VLVTPELEAMVASFCPKDLPSMTVSAAIQSKPASILVVEDNPINQKILEMMLAKLGYSCHLAANGIEAVQKACSYPYSLIFLDIEMPEMPGTTAAKIMREKGISTPIVALSAHVLLEVQKDALEAGMDQFITKPVKVATLKRILERWIPSSQ
jgi:CheY-like chemotaxis protein